MSGGMRIAAFVVLTLVATVSAQAAAMRCSGEEKLCIDACTRSVAKPLLSRCITACGQRSAACMKTGCWDGAQRYCGLHHQ